MRRLRDQRGLTLTELTVAMVMAAIVLTGLVGFYLSSQATWVDGSSKVISQREVTLVLSTIATRAHSAKAAIVTASGTQCMLEFYRTGSGSSQSDSTYYFWWDPADSLIHEGYRIPVVVDCGPILQSKVEQFSVSTDASMVHILNLQVYSAQGTRISMGTDAAFMNKGAP